jgi:hypothetical protein
MALAALARFTIAGDSLNERHRSGAGLRGHALRSTVFTSCDFFHVTVHGVDPSGTSFKACQLDGRTR